MQVPNPDEFDSTVLRSISQNTILTVLQQNHAICYNRMNRKKGAENKEALWQTALLAAKELTKEMMVATMAIAAEMEEVADEMDDLEAQMDELDMGKDPNQTSMEAEWEEQDAQLIRKAENRIAAMSEHLGRELSAQEQAEIMEAESEGLPVIAGFR